MYSFKGTAKKFVTRPEEVFTHVIDRSKERFLQHKVAP